MKKAVGAILYHLSANTNDEERHKFCPRSQDSWCKFQADKITQKSTARNTQISQRFLGRNLLLKVQFPVVSLEYTNRKCGIYALVSNTGNYG